MPEIISPEKTFAIVAGIEQYGAGIAELDGPAHDALRFIEWLREMKVPPQNIVAHIAPTPENAEDCRLRLESARLPKPNQRGGDYEAIRDSLLNAPARLDGDLLFLFWGGHGMYSYKENQQLLLVAGASQKDCRGFGAEDILKFLRVRQYGGQSYGSRIALIDACADEKPTGGRETILPLQDNVYQLGASAEDIRLASFQAAALGQEARQQDAGERRTGVFSNLALEWLAEEENRQLPPAVADLIEHLKIEFESKGISQQPVFLEVGDWDGNRKVVIDKLLSRERMRRLHAAHEALRLLNQTGLTTAELERFYETTLSDDARDHAAKDSDQMLAILPKVQPRDGIKVDREVEFIWRAATADANNPIEPLREWVNRQVEAQPLADLEKLLRDERLHAREKINHLLIDIPGGSLAKRNKIKYWFYAGNPEPETGQIENHEEADKVRQAISKLISEKKNQAAGKLWIEMYVPFDWLNHGIEQWECLSLLGDAPFLGEEHPIVLRWRERAQCAEATTNYGEWRRRAAKIRDKQYCPLAKTHWFESPEAKPRELMTWLTNNNYGSFVSFTFAPAIESIKGTLVGGAPFAFWRRTDFTDWPKFKTLLNAIAVRGQLDDLPHGIRQLRDESKRREDHHGSALTLLWDDPNRNPLGNMLG
jgi:hypothetical protein